MGVVQGETVVDEVAEFCRREHPALVGALGLYVGDRDVAEDLAQETLLRVCREWPTVRRCDSPRAWAMCVAFNLARSRFRRAAVARRALSRLAGRAAVDDEADGAEVLAVRRAVLGLPERQRRVLVLRYYADLLVRDVAALLSCPEGTVKTLTRQALAGLRRAGLEVDADG